jgi:multiple sugar transport system permease protein
MLRSQTRTHLLFLAPSLLLIFVFMVIPALFAFYISFTNMALTGINALNYRLIGGRNYIKLLTDENFQHSLWLTLQFAFGTIAGQFVLGLSVALILNRRRVFGQPLLLALAILPMVIPAVIQALIWSSMLGAAEFGTLNRILGLVGLAPVGWTRTLPLTSVLLVNFWNNSGFAMILFLAGLEGIPSEILESASIDGANGRQMLLQIKLPLIRYVILLWLLLNTIGCLNTFDLVYALTTGGPGNATEILGIYIYNSGFRYSELGYGSAVAMVLLLISLGIAYIYVRLMRVEL